MARSLRQSKIIELVSQNEIETQDEICQALIASGFNATQATVSRDIKELGLIKVSGKDKKYKYAYIEADHTLSSKVIGLFRACVLSVKSAKNLVLVKTLSGNGSSAGMCVDKLNLPYVVGSVAGDDTLLIVTESDDGAQIVTNKIKEILQVTNA